MVQRTLLFSLALASVLAIGGPEREGRAQSLPGSSVRATNLARMTAERLNGGLGVYRAAACMHQQGGGACLLRASADGFVFRFPGGEPGWQALNKAPTVETELKISADGRTVSEVIYNGPPRQPPRAGTNAPQNQQAR